MLITYIDFVIFYGEKYSALAPLAGWSDSPFRQLCREFGADLVFSEMISADGTVRNQAKTITLAEFSESERPIGLQIFGAEPETVAEAVRILSRLKPDFIDLNFGCPAKKVVRRGAGSALLKDLPLMQKIAAAAVRATDLPVTAKLRSGWDAASINAVEAAKRLADVGIAALTVHPRTQTMQFSGKADWQIIRQVVEAVSIPVIGNGDVKSAADARRMLDETGCRGVMVGRAACGNPWIFLQIRRYLDRGIPPSDPSPAERAQTALDHLQRTIEKMGERQAVAFMRKQLIHYFKGLPHASLIRQQLVTATGFQDVEAALKTAAQQVPIYENIAL